MHAVSLSPATIACCCSCRRASCRVVCRALSRVLTPGPHSQQRGSLRAQQLTVKQTLAMQLLVQPTVVLLHLYRTPCCTAASALSIHPIPCCCCSAEIGLEILKNGTLVDAQPLPYSASAHHPLLIAPDVLHCVCPAAAVLSLALKC
jgi:hypothetical protein